MIAKRNLFCFAFVIDRFFGFPRLLVTKIGAGAGIILRRAEYSFPGPHVTKAGAGEALCDLFNVRRRITLFLINFIALNFFAARVAHAQTTPEQSITIDYQGRPQKVTYDFYIPPSENTGRIPVLVCIGGLPMEGEKYIRSDTGECLDAVWKNFADQNHIAILGLGFLFIPEDWKTKTSYQYPGAWSGEGLAKILKIVSEQFSIDPNELYFWGVSAGAQFSIRFAQMYPKIVKAVAAHAAGGYDLPQEFLPTKFLITVGRFDNKEITRMEMAEVFARACRLKKIDLTLKIIPGIAHRQTEEQNAMSRRFFRNVFWSRKNRGVNFLGWGL